jgi:antirestriction protein
MSIDTTESNPSIFVGTYAKYNNGSLYGQWLDLTEYSDKDEFYEACKELHTDEDDPEFMFHTWENIPKFLISESHISEKSFEYFTALDELDDDKKAGFEIYINIIKTTSNKEAEISELFIEFDNCYEGYFKGFTPKADFVCQYVEIGNYFEGNSDFMQRYFDYDKLETDLFLDGYTEHKGHIFSDN